MVIDNVGHILMSNNKPFVDGPYIFYIWSGGTHGIMASPLNLSTRVRFGVILPLDPDTAYFNQYEIGTNVGIVKRVKTQKNKQRKCQLKLDHRKVKPNSFQDA